MAKRLNSDFKISRPSLPPPSLSTPPFLHHIGSDSVLILKYFSVAMGHFKFKLGMTVEGISNDRESEIRLYFLQTSKKCLSDQYFKSVNRHILCMVPKRVGWCLYRPNV